MDEIKRHEPNTFCWVDLATSDAEAAKKFYAELFGWEAVDTPAGEGMTYTMLNLNDKPVAALYKMSAEQEKMNIPPNWASYVSVEDVGATMKKVAELGGEVIMDAFDVMESGRMGLLKDPTGAFLGVWEPKKHVGAAYKNVPGSLCWNEIGTRDIGKAIQFFAPLFGWTAISQQMGDMLYTSFRTEESMVGGMYSLPDNMKEVPPHWLPYFSVVDCDESAKKVAELGGNIIMGPTHIPGVGNFAVVQDPQQAVFAIITMEPMD